jgi:regulator of cell morphogenesis and NO signaling
MKTKSLIKLENTVGDGIYITAKTLNEANIDCDKIKNTISEDGNMAEFNKCDTDFLIDYIIKTHHAFAKKNAVIIYDLLQKVAYRHSDQHNELKKLNDIAFFFFQDLLNQMLKEEQDLFPYIRHAAKNMEQHNRTGNNVLQSLEKKIKLQQIKYEQSFNYLKVFREITSDYEIPLDACNYYKSLFKKMKELEHDLKLHFHLEDDILFDNAMAAHNEPKQETKFKKN